MPKVIKLQTLIITLAGVFLVTIGLSFFFLNFYTTHMPARQDAPLQFAKSRTFQAENAPLLAKSELVPSSIEVPAQPIPKVGLKIIKTGSLRFQVKDYRKSRAAIIDFVKKHHAYLASENEEHNDDSIQNTMAIRVPAAQFDILLDSLVKESVHLENKTVEAQDVTAEFIDVEARLKAKKAVEQRYLTILNQAHSVKDILDIESQLGIIREAIDSTEGQLKYLNDQVMYSTLSLTFYQSIKRLPQPESGFWYNISAAFVKGWNAFLAIIIGVIYLWPFLIIAGGLVLVYRKFWQQKKK
jgi:Domain of unknown function (DUF4349)